VPERTNKVVSAEEAIRHYVTDGCQELAVGGAQFHNCPMALVREIVRQRLKIKRLVTGPSASISADLLVGSGLVDEILSPYVGFDHLGLAPSFRRAAEGGMIRVLECDEALLVHGLRAGAGGLPFAPCPPGIELTDLPQANPDYYRKTVDPFTGTEVIVSAPIRPNVALIHCQEADTHGNAVFRGATFADLQMAMASDTVILQVEHVAAPERIRNSIDRNVLPGFLVSAVVEIPFGCHPTSSHRFYNADTVHLKQYLAAARSADSLETYIRQFIIEVRTETEYLARVSGTEMPEDESVNCGD
jgi:glutaconate CoA-transferase, subunit A